MKELCSVKPDKLDNCSMMPSVTGWVDCGLLTNVVRLSFLSFYDFWANSTTKLSKLSHK